MTDIDVTRGCLPKAEREGFDTDLAATCVLAALAIAKAAGKPMTGEELVDVCIAAGHVPHNHKAFGGMFARLARHGQIRRVGFAPRRKGHGAPGASLWEIV